MKKQINKIALKTDKIVTLTKNQAQNMVGGRPTQAASTTCNCPF